MRIGDLVTFNKKMWHQVFKAYTCKTVDFTPDSGTDHNDFRCEYLSMDVVMMVLCVHRVFSGDKLLVLSPTGRAGWVWDVWVKSIDRVD